jgi:hypothetical protein
MNKKTLYIVLAIIIIALLAFWYYSSQKTAIQTLVVQNTISMATTSDQTANWKTYTNTQYGFEVKYPSSASIQTFPNKAEIIYPRNTDLVYDILFVNPGFTMQQYVDTLNSNGVLTSQKPISVNGIQGIDVQLNAKAAVPLTRTAYFQSQNGSIISIVYWLNSNQEYTSIGNEIISSFQFSSSTAQTK